MSELENDLNENIVVKDASEIVAECYTELSEYVIKTRSYASVVDGLKAVYRRTIYASRDYHNKIKSVAIVGDAIKLHPHGDASITDVLNRMACKYGKFPLYSSKGNFGGLGSGAAAPRYTEACLSELGRLMYLELIDYAEMIDGEAGFPEPRYLPALLPHCLLVGSGGIPVGMPTPNIPPLNALELVDYWIAKLEGSDRAKLPIVDYGNVVVDIGREWVEDMVTKGQGKLYYKGLVTQEDENTYSVSAGTPKCYIEKLPDKLAWWIDNDIIDFMDESDINGYRYVFTTTDTTQMPSKTLKDKLENILKCSETYRFILEENDTAVYCGIDYIYKKNIKYLTECTLRKYTDLASKVESKLVILRAIRDFKNGGYVAKLNDMEDTDVIKVLVDLGYEEWVGKAVLDRPIKYLNKSHDDEIRDLENDQEINNNYLEHPDQYLLTLYYRLREILEKFDADRGHSILANEVVDKSKYSAELVNGDTIRVTESKKGTKWNRNLILVNNDLVVNKRFISINSEVDIQLNEKWDIMASDKGEYLVIIVGNCIAVKRVSEITSGRPIAKTWEGMKVTGAFTTSNEVVELVDERNNVIEIKIKDYLRSRISNPIRCNRYDIVGEK